MPGPPTHLPPFGVAYAQHITLGGSPVAFTYPTASASASASVGVADTVTWIAVPPESHPHDQEHRQPLEAVEVFSMTGTIALLVGYKAAQGLRHSFIKLRCDGPPEQENDP